MGAMRRTGTEGGEGVMIDMILKCAALIVLALAAYGLTIALRLLLEIRQDREDETGHSDKK